MNTPAPTAQFIVSRCAGQRLALAALALGLALPLGAEVLSADAEVVTLDRYHVAGYRDTDYAATLSTGALKTATPLLETPQAIAVISRFQIADQAAQNLQEVLRYAPGVRAEMYGLDNRGDWFTLRGGSEGSTVLDGLRLPLTGWYGMVRNEPFAFERIEVLRGPASVMFGQNGPGGVINLVSKLPQPVAAGEINLQVGTLDHRQVAIDSTGPLSTDATLLYRVVGLAKDAGTQINLAGEERQFFAPSFTWEPNSSTTFTVIAQYQRDESDNTNAFLPWAGTILPAPNGPIPDDLFIGEPEWDSYGGRRLRAGYHFEHRFLGGQWALRQNFRYDDVSGHHRSMYANFWEEFLPGGRQLNRTWYASENDNRIVNADLLLEGRLSSGAFQHTLLIGVDGLWTRDRQATLSGAGTPLDVYTPAYGTFPLPALDFDAPAVTVTRQLGLTLLDSIKFNERWVVVAGLRGDNVSTSSNDDDALSSRVGLVYLANGGWAPYLSYSESFEAVGGSDLAGRPYKPERGEQLEAGLKWAPKDGRIAAAAALYTLREKNRLTTDPTNPLNSVQRGEVTVNGAEFELTSTLGSWTIVANYTFTDAEVSASSDPNDPYLHHRLPSIPEHSAALWAVHTFTAPALNGLRAGLGVRHVGETWDGTDSLRTPSNTLLDALISYDRGPWHLALNATNVFDKSYIVTALDRGDSWFGSRRKVIGTVSYRW